MYVRNSVKVVLSVQNFLALANTKKFEIYPSIFAIEHNFWTTCNFQPFQARLTSSSYEYDCCGFVCHVLESSSPRAYGELRRWAGIENQPGKCVGFKEEGRTWREFAQVCVHYTCQKSWYIPHLYPSARRITFYCSTHFSGDEEAGDSGILASSEWCHSPETRRHPSQWPTCDDRDGGPTAAAGTKRGKVTRAFKFTRTGRDFWPVHLTQPYWRHICS